MQKLFYLVTCSLLICFAGDSHAQPAAKHRVVIQLSSADTSAWRGVINNIKNMKKGWGKDLQVEVVAHGQGIGFLIKGKTTQQEAIKMLTEQGIRFVICENTLRDRNIDRTEVIPESGFVPMGVGEIVMKQEEGWSYLKAGL